MSRHADVHIITENKRTKLNMNGTYQARTGHCMVVIHRPGPDGKITSTTKHCVPPGSVRFLAENT